MTLPRGGDFSEFGYLLTLLLVSGNKARFPLEKQQWCQLNNLNKLQHPCGKTIQSLNSRSHSSVVIDTFFDSVLFEQTRTFMLFLIPTKSRDSRFCKVPAVKASSIYFATSVRKKVSKSSFSNFHDASRNSNISS